MCLLTFYHVFLSLPGILECFSHLSVTMTNTWDKQLVVGKDFNLQVWGILSMAEQSLCFGVRSKAAHCDVALAVEQNHSPPHWEVKEESRKGPSSCDVPQGHPKRSTLWQCPGDSDFHTRVFERQSKSTLQCGLRVPLSTTGSSCPPSGCWIQQPGHVASLWWFGLKKEAQRPSDENIFFYELKNKMTVSSKQIPVHNEMNINVYGGIDLEDFFF